MDKKPNTKCRVCGKEYFCCGDSRAINSWRAVTCSTDCYKEYIRRIEESRKTPVEQVKTAKKTTKTSKKVKDEAENE